MAAELFIVVITCAVSSFFGAFIARRIEFHVEHEASKPETTTKRAPVYQNRAKAASYLAGSEGPTSIPSTWIRPE